jgi:multiple sugar transport system permease protein
MSVGWLRTASRAAGRYGVLVALVAFAGAPFYWMLLTAIKQNRDLYVGAYERTHVPWILNDPPTLEHLRLLFTGTDFPRWALNSFLVLIAVALITVVVAVPAGYSLARLAGRWGERLSIAIFLTYLVPSTLLFIPFSRLVALIGLQNSLWALVVVYPTFTVPFCTWLLMGFFKSLPREIEESAMVDGCSRVGAIWRMVLPLSVPGLLTVVIFALTLVIQEFVYSLTFISSVERMTVSVGVPVALVRGDVYYWGSLMAACLITSIPIAVLYNIFLDRFIAGFTVGAIK